MNLYIFPESAMTTNGYGIIVDNDYALLTPRNSDIVVWYTNKTNHKRLEKQHHLLKRPKKISIKRLSNMLKNNAGSEAIDADFDFLDHLEFDTIFCGDVLFYRAMRKRFPYKQLTVRFHNCFSRILDRKNLLKISLDLKFLIDLKAMYKLEQEIFLDANVHKIFLSEEDCTYYKLMTGRSDASIWPVKVDVEKGKHNRYQFCNNKLIWAGGVESHKKKSVQWFIKEVWPKIQEKNPQAEFHLWGMRTQQFNNSRLHIYGHGFFNGEGLPVKNEGLYINPDIIGGGVKIKIKTFLEEGVPFISTPFGFEGFSNELIDNKYCIVKEKDHWAESIISQLNN